MHSKNPTDKVIAAMLGTCFDPLGEAYAFYNLYSWKKDFGIRHGKSMLNVERTKCMQTICPAIRMFVFGFADANVNYYDMKFGQLVRGSNHFQSMILDGFPGQEGREL